MTFLARLFEEHGELLQYPRRERQHERENVKVFGASNVKACHSFNIHTRVLILGIDVLYWYNIGVVGSNLIFFPPNFHLF